MLGCQTHGRCSLCYAMLQQGKLTRPIPAPSGTAVYRFTRTSSRSPLLLLHSVTAYSAVGLWMMLLIYDTYITWYTIVTTSPIRRRTYLHPLHSTAKHPQLATYSMCQASRFALSSPTLYLPWACCFPLPLCIRCGAMGSWPRSILVRIHLRADLESRTWNFRSFFYFSGRVLSSSTLSSVSCTKYNCCMESYTATSKHSTNTSTACDTPSIGVSK